MPVINSFSNHFFSANAHHIHYLLPAINPDTLLLDINGTVSFVTKKPGKFLFRKFYKTQVHLPFQPQKSNLSLEGQGCGPKILQIPFHK